MSKRNMYGCEPCPKCKSKFRWPTQKGTIQCDDCGHIERYKMLGCEALGNGNEHFGLHDWNEFCKKRGCVSEQEMEGRDGK